MCQAVVMCVCVMQHLGELVIGFLKRELQPPCQLTCLETVRILSRDERSQGPFISHCAMSTLARYAGLIMTGSEMSDHSHSGPGNSTQNGPVFLGLDSQTSKLENCRIRPDLLLHWFFSVEMKEFRRVMSCAMLLCEATSGMLFLVRASA